MNSEEWGRREPPGGNVKKRDWIPFVSLGVFLGTMNLAIAGLGFSRIDRLEDRIDRLEDRMDRLEVRMDRFEARIEQRFDDLEARMEERLDDLDRRVSRIEGVLLLRAEEAADGDPPRPANGERGPPAPGG